MPSRISDDRCPGVLRPFSAADGAIVRLRLPGGRVRTTTLLAVTRLARDHGQPFVQVTSRANLQLRGLPEPVPTSFVEAVGALGLLPSATHDRVRNILAEPSPALDELAARVDESIRARPELSNLSGRWTFALAVSTPWLTRMPYDVAYQRLTATDGVLVVGDRRLGCSDDEAAVRLVELAVLFTRCASDAGVWNVRDVPPDHSFFGIVDAWTEAAGLRPHVETDDVAPPTDEESLTLHLPLGLLDERLAAALADEADDVVVTPDRSIVVRRWRADVTTHEAQRRLVAAGFTTRTSSAATLFSACIGAPWCRRTTTPTLDLTRRATELVDGARSATPWAREPVRTHVVGCDRACGRPSSPHRLVIAPRDVAAVMAEPAPSLPPTSSHHERPNGSPRV